MNTITHMYDSIKTKRLHLRRFTESDWEDMYEYISDPEVMRYEPLLTETENREWVAARIACNDFWAVCLADTGKMIDDIYLGEEGQNHWEIGYMFNSKYQKQGYATEAAGPLICRTFQIEGAHRISAFCNPDNIASWKLLERLGVRREGYLRQNVTVRQDENGNPIWQDTFLYGILKGEWLKNHMP